MYSKVIRSKPGCVPTRTSAVWTMSLPLASSVSGSPQIQASGGGVGELVALTVSPALSGRRRLGGRAWVRPTHWAEADALGIVACERADAKDERARPDERHHGEDAQADAKSEDSRFRW